MFRFGYYQPASSTDFVAKLVNGSKVASGKGRVFFYGPRTSLAVVPTAEQGIGFMFRELTKDTQELVVQGTLQISFLPNTLLDRYDFTINLQSGAYIKADNFQRLTADLQNALQSVVRDKVAAADLDRHMEDRAALANQVIAAAKTKAEEFKKLGVVLIEAFVTGISPFNRELQKAFEAKKREELLGNADKALADRQMAAAQSQRELRQFEADTDFELEEKRQQLVQARNANLIAEAEAEAEAMGKKLEPYKAVDGGRLLALALQEFAKSGNIQNFSITPDFLTAVRTAADSRG